MNQKNKGGRGLACTERNEAIRAARYLGYSYDRIAKDFGISKSRAIQLCNPEKTRLIEAAKRGKAKDDEINSWGSALIKQVFTKINKASQLP